MKYELRGLLLDIEREGLLQVLQERARCLRLARAPAPKPHPCSVLHSRGPEQKMRAPETPTEAVE